MRARAQIEKAAIVRTALDILRDAGWENVSARSIAARLGSSTMPIYTAIGSMKELHREILAAASRLAVQALKKPRTGNEALDPPLAYVMFALEEPRLWRFLSQSITPGPESDGLHNHEEAAGLGKEGARRAWIFAHGLADLVATGRLVIDEGEIIHELQMAMAAFSPRSRERRG